jgi:hypothetical protein
MQVPTPLTSSRAIKVTLTRAAPPRRNDDAPSPPPLGIEWERTIDPFP